MKCPRCEEPFVPERRRLAPALIVEVSDLPEPGDKLICLTCSMPCVVGDDGEARRPTDAEKQEMSEDDAYVGVLNQVMRYAPGRRVNRPATGG